MTIPRIRLNDALTALVEAMMDSAAAAAREKAIREELAAAAREVYRRDGAAPTWRHQLATVSLSVTPASRSVRVTDRAALADHIAEAEPGLAAMRVTVPVDKASALTEVLDFLGLGGAKVETVVDDETVDRWVKVACTAETDGTVTGPGGVVAGVEAVRTPARSSVRVLVDAAIKADMADRSAIAAKEAVADLFDDETASPDVTDTPAGGDDRGQAPAAVDAR